jgi:hypothetical protein
VKSRQQELVALDRAGVVLRSVRLDPHPFGAVWTVERVGGRFIVRDPSVLSAYDDRGRLQWKRAQRSRIAFAGVLPGESRHVSIAPSADGAGVDIGAIDLETGDVENALRLDGTLTFIGPNGARVDDVVLVATDERHVFAVDVTRWAIVSSERFDASHLLRPIATEDGVHFAAVRRLTSGAETRLVSFDRQTFQFADGLRIPGEAHALTSTGSEVLLEVARADGVEQLAFRTAPNEPALALVRVKKRVPLVPPSHRRLTTAAVVLPRRRESPSEQRQRRAVILPGEGPETATSEEKRARLEELGHGFLDLLRLVDAHAPLLARLAGVLVEKPRQLLKLGAAGLTLRDPRARWAVARGRDPCLVAIGEDAGGATLATYFYPPRGAGPLPVVRVDPVTGEALWLADDFDVWFRGFLSEAIDRAPGLVRELVETLELRLAVLPPPMPSPPVWFFEAHGTRPTERAAADALAAGDLLGVERALVGLARVQCTDAIKDQLASVYTMLGWDHQRAVVAETW